MSVPFLPLLFRVSKPKKTYKKDVRGLFDPQYLSENLSRLVVQHIGTIRRLVHEDAEGNAALIRSSKSNHLPAFAPGHLHEDCSSGNLAAQLDNPSGFISLDIDHISDLPGGRTSEDMRDFLSEHPSVLIAGISPSGDGVKCLVRVINADTGQPDQPVEERKALYKLSYAKVWGVFSEYLGFDIADHSGQDIGRKAFASHDEGYKYNEAAEALDLDLLDVPERWSSKSSPKSKSETETETEAETKSNPTIDFYNDIDPLFRPPLCRWAQEDFDKLRSATEGGRDLLLSVSQKLMQQSPTIDIFRTEIEPVLRSITPSWGPDHDWANNGQLEKWMEEFSSDVGTKLDWMQGSAQYTEVLRVQVAKKTDGPSKKYNDARSELLDLLDLPQEGIDDTQVLSVAESKKSELTILVGRSDAAIKKLESQLAKEDGEETNPDDHRLPKISKQRSERTSNQDLKKRISSLVTVVKRGLPDVDAIKADIIENWRRKKKEKDLRQLQGDSVPSEAAQNIRDELLLFDDLLCSEMIRESHTRNHPKADLLPHYDTFPFIVCNPSRRYRVWNGSYWEHMHEHDIPNLLSSRYLVHLADSISQSELLNSDELTPKEKYEIKKDTLKQKESLCGLRKANNVFGLLRGDMALSFDESAAYTKPHTLPLSDKTTLDLSTGETNKTRWEDYPLACAGVIPNDMPTPEWDAFMESIIEPDRSNEWIVEAIHSVCGYALTGVREQLFVYFRGAGREGKGVIARTLGKIMGSFLTSAAQSVFFSKSSTTRHDHHLLDYLGKRVVYVSDPAGRTEEELLLKWTGGDAIKAEKKGGELLEFTPEALILISGQTERLRIAGDDNALAGRMRIIPFTVSFAGKEDTDLEGRLKEELPGIMHKFIGYAQRYLQDGALLHEDKMRQTTQEEMEERDAILDFLDECCVPFTAMLDGVEGPDREHFIENKEIYKLYNTYCEQNKMKPLGRTTFLKSLEKRRKGWPILRIAKKIEGKKERGFCGIGIRDKYRQPPESPEQSEITQAVEDTSFPFGENKEEGAEQWYQ